MSSPTLADRVRWRLAAGAGEADQAVIDATARSEADLVVDSATLADLAGRVTAELIGAGPLEPLLAMPGVTDVLVNGCDDVWIDRGFGLERATARFDDDQAVRRLAARLAAQAGRRLDDAAPFVDASLSDGTRLHAILPPLVRRPTMSLRVLTRRRFSFGDLVSVGSVPPVAAKLLERAVAARLTVLISGGTGTGKTTLLAALLGLATDSDRIVTIEDAPELMIDHPHVVGLIARPGNIEGAGAVPLRELVRQSLRMRADRIVVGEFRGAEIVELLTALNTGHSGGAATVHANSVRDVASRLNALAALGGMHPSMCEVQAASAFDLLIHVHRDSAGRRGVSDVALWPQAGSAPVAVWSELAGLGPGAAGLARQLAEAEGVQPSTVITGSGREPR